MAGSLAAAAAAAAAAALHTQHQPSELAVKPLYSSNVPSPKNLLRQTICAPSAESEQDATSSAVQTSPSRTHTHTHVTRIVAIYRVCDADQDAENSHGSELNQITSYVLYFRLYLLDAIPRTGSLFLLLISRQEVTVTRAAIGVYSAELKNKTNLQFRFVSQETNLLLVDQALSQ